MIYLDESKALRMVNYQDLKPTILKNLSLYWNFNNKFSYGFFGLHFHATTLIPIILDFKMIMENLE